MVLTCRPGTVRFLLMEHLNTKLPQHFKLSGRCHRGDANYIVSVSTCNQCNAMGIKPYWVPVNGGICFDCDGIKTVVSYYPTEEWSAVLKGRRLKRDAKKLAKRQAMESKVCKRAPMVAYGMFLLSQRSETADDMFDKYLQGKKFSEKQARYMVSLLLREFRKMQWATEKAAQPVCDVPQGDKLAVIGKVLSTKWVEGYSYYSPDTLKMLVLDDTGFKVWGTVSAKLLEQANKTDTEIKGSRVSFAANLTRSDDDPTFGFFKRPTKAKLLSAE